MPRLAAEDIKLHNSAFGRVLWIAFERHDTCVGPQTLESSIVLVKGIPREALRVAAGWPAVGLGTTSAANAAAAWLQGTRTQATTSWSSGEAEGPCHRPTPDSPKLFP